MSAGITILRTLPGPASLEPILRDFAKREGVVTSTSDACLPLCRSLTEDCAGIDVIPFGQLVRELLSLCGELALGIAPSGHVRAAVAHACSQLPSDSPFAASALFPGTHEAIGRTLDELSDWGIGAAELRALTAHTSGRLAEKLESLATISEEVGRIAEALGRQRSDEHVRACLDGLPETDGSLRRLLVVAGSELPPLKQRWLAWLAGHGVDVRVVLDRHATEEVLFGAVEPVWRAAEKVAAFGTGNLLLNNLFATGDHGGSEVEVGIVSAADPLAEAEWAVRGCLESPAPHRAAIYARNLEEYAPLIEAAATRLGLPIRLFRRAPLLTNAYARLTLAVLEFCAGRDVRKLYPVLRSSYVGLPPDARDLLTDALREAHRARADAWGTLTRWCETQRDAFGWLWVLLEWRAKALAGPYSMRQWMALLSDLIRADERLPWSTQGASAEARMRERDLRARNRMEQLLGDHASVELAAKGGLYSLSDIVDTCRRLWGDADVSVPPAEHGAIVTDSPEMLEGVDHLHVLGMLEGVFPRRRSEDPILTDRERETISSLRPGERPLPTSHDRSRAERDAFYRVCAGARERIVFSYPVADDQRDNIPAFYLAEVRRAVGSSTRFFERAYPRPMLAPPLDGCVAERDRLLRLALDGEREYPPEVDVTTIPAKLALRPEPDARFSPEELRDALQCPFQYVARHRLRLKPNRPRARWASLRRLPQAASMPTRSPEELESALRAALEAELEAMLPEVPEWEIPLLRFGGERLIQEWVIREKRAREKWPKLLGSVRPNARFGTDLRDAMPKSTGVVLRGTVPALSQLGSFKVAHLISSTAPENKQLTDTERLYYGLHFLALFERQGRMALEVESMSGRRSLLVLDRHGVNLPGHSQEGLQVIDLASDDDSSGAREAFLDGVKDLLKRSADTIRQGEIRPTPGDHCVWCDFGELCRRSTLYPEEDSPFGLDGGEPGD